MFFIHYFMTLWSSNTYFDDCFYGTDEYYTAIDEYIDRYMHCIHFEEYLNGETGCGYDWESLSVDYYGTIWYNTYCLDEIFPIHMGCRQPSLHTCAIPSPITCNLPSYGTTSYKLITARRKAHNSDHWCDASGTPVLSWGDLYEPYWENIS